MPRLRLPYLLLAGLLVYVSSVILFSKNTKTSNISKEESTSLNNELNPNAPLPQEIPLDTSSPLLQGSEEEKAFTENIWLPLFDQNLKPDESPNSPNLDDDVDSEADPPSEEIPVVIEYSESDWKTHYSPMSQIPPPHAEFLPNRTLANAVIVILCRNSELQALRRSIREFEDRFNRKYGYPYVFLNDVPFTQEFKEIISNLTYANTTFGLIPQEMWGWPPWVEQKTALRCMQNLQTQGKNNKTYGFNIILHEIRATIPSLYQHTLKFAESANLTTRLLRFFGEPSKGWVGYNLCHFWSNFEIASMSLWRNPTYEAYFDYLDHTGNFFYERWGDAPIHTLALGLMANKSEIHFFNDIGYKHDSFAHCVDDEASGLNRRCMCPSDHKNFDTDAGSCLQDWLAYREEGYQWDFPPNNTAIWEDPPNHDHDLANAYPGFQIQNWIDQEVPLPPGMGEGRKVIKIPDVVWYVVQQGRLGAVPEGIRAVWQAKGWLDWVPK
ncbi:nucleotide-diphospho-sugar transferase [Jimgerdemannia flammicorona]|uniref:Nucleotide-diphospho-sugar transferase n=1 Tax=Jimgerdemannia flammicorona TaxID=994334 RepID=A0A433QUF9_9FUNG|nr:nucleotide-diphospho-sugar transferase [Jimgerdemannia flammicorona]